MSGVKISKFGAFQGEMMNSRLWFGLRLPTEGSGTCFQSELSIYERNSPFPPFISLPSLWMFVPHEVWVPDAQGLLCRAEFSQSFLEQLGKESRGMQQHMAAPLPPPCGHPNHSSPAMRKCFTIPTCGMDQPLL